MNILDAFYANHQLFDAVKRCIRSTFENFKQLKLKAEVLSEAKKAIVKLLLQ